MGSGARAAVGIGDCVPRRSPVTLTRRPGPCAAACAACDAEDPAFAAPGGARGEAAADGMQEEKKETFALQRRGPRHYVSNIAAPKSSFSR